MRRLWTSIPISMASLTALIFALFATGALAHEGHPNSDGRIFGKPDFQRIGTHEFEFHPKAHAYTYRRSPNGVPLWFHVDDFAASSPFAPGALYDLPASTEPVVCANSGHRIKVAYAESYPKWKSQDPYMTIADREAIRNAVLRMNWKIQNESLLSSDGAMALKMRVDCDGLGQINVSEFVVFSYPYNDPNSVWATADQVLGAPSGADAIKHLIFFDGPGPVVNQYGTTASGFGEVLADSKKSSSDASDGNSNRRYTASAVIYNPGGLDPLGYWDSHVTLHELFHTMGAVQPNAPFATSAMHCTDGIDVMCYHDASPAGSTYAESSCPSPAYSTPVATPLDCGYDSYFDALEESKEWLSTNWNVGGAENPFLVASRMYPYQLRNSNSGGPPDYTFTLTDQQASDIPIAGNWDGIGGDTVGFFRPTTATFYLRNSNSTGAASHVFQFGAIGDRPVAGDWNKDGTDTIGVYRPNGGMFYLRDSNSAGPAQYQFQFGNTSPSEDLPVSGDWNKDGTDTIGVYRQSNSSFYLRNSNSNGVPDYSFSFGNAGTDDLPVTGDWDGNGFASVGVFRQSLGQWFQDNELPGNQPISYVHTFGPFGHTSPIAGDWNGDGSDTPGAAWK